MSSLIWGLLLVVIGAELIIKAVFGINLPVLRIAFGFFLVYLGATFIADSGKSIIGSHKKRTIAFERATIHATNPNKNYTVMFSEAVIDLSALEIDKQASIDISTVFGTTTLLINPDIPTRIIAQAHFGNAILPDSTQLTFGEHTFRTGDRTQKPHLEIHAKVTFGTLVIKNA